LTLGGEKEKRNLKMKHKKYTEASTTRNTNLRNYHLLKNLAAQATTPSFLPWLC
jgi:hypothetical protein